MFFILLDCILIYNAWTLGYWWEIRRLVIMIWFNLTLIWFYLSFLEDEQELSVGVFDATILFDSFIYIYLVFCICFVYKMPWYSLFYVLKAFLDERFKKEVIEPDWQIWPSVGVLCRAEALEIQMKWFQWHLKSNILIYMEI